MPQEPAHFPAAAGSPPSAYCAKWCRRCVDYGRPSFDTAPLAYELVLPPSSENKHSILRGERLFAAFFGIPQACLVPHWASFLSLSATWVR
jgi:hypothetical protein